MEQTARHDARRHTLRGFNRGMVTLPPLIRITPPPGRRADYVRRWCMLAVIVAGCRPPPPGTRRRVGRIWSPSVLNDTRMYCRHRQD